MEMEMETDENGRPGCQKSPFFPPEDPGCEPIVTFMHTELVQSHSLMGSQFHCLTDCHS